MTSLDEGSSPLVRPTEPHLTLELDCAEQSFVTINAERLALRHRRRVQFPVGEWQVEQLEQLGARIERTAGFAGNRQLTVDLSFAPRTIATFAAQGGFADLQVAGDSFGDAEEICEHVSSALRDVQQPREETRVPVHFWTRTQMGPRPMRMKIEAPRWDEIAGNYASAIRDDLAQMMQARRDEIEGVALWRGDPGTGKTTALRALAMEWARWCDVHVIVDPEIFLGEGASYLMDVLFSFQDPYTDQLNMMMAAGAPPEAIDQMMMGHGVAFAMGDVDDDEDEDEDDYDGADGPDFYERYRRQAMGSRAKLIVLEDAGELVSADARASSGQALSRLLNMTDGMLGQGANISVLVTTNEPIESLHPAIQRPGRCWAQMEFQPLPVDEANAWLAHNGVDDHVRHPAAIAELYSIKRGDNVIRLDNLAG